MVGRYALLGLLALIAGFGCSAGTSGNLAKRETPLTKESLTATRIIAQHNKNAATIQSLKATPSIEVGGDAPHGRLTGYLAMERPRDFRLEMKLHGSRKADIGSNDQGFWFWVSDRNDRSIYVCDYEHISASPLAVTMQPDWILEAMGLREITDREAATINAKPSDKPGQLVLTQLRKDAKGETTTKETLVDESSGEIIEHRLYSGAKKELLARATISQYQYIKLDPTDDNPSGSKVAVPSRFRLEWLAEKFSLDITMSDPTINPRFSSAQKTALFIEPSISGVARKNLAALPGSPSATSSRIYESSPRSGVRLGKPQAEPIEVEGSIRYPRDPQPTSPDPTNTSTRPTGVVLAPVPLNPDPSTVQASGSRNGPRPILEQ